MNQDSETVYLSDLKLFGATSTIQAPSSTKTADPSPAISRSKPHERLAADKTGEELAPDAGIWQIYLDEAKEYDDELVTGKNENLDQMLLFATLFSAIVTAFLIESKNLLQPDPTEITISLLLMIAQSQQRLEQGDPRLTSAPIQLPRFSVSMLARWINGLWFISLALSLSAALIALLAKEWLAAYNTSRPRPPHTYALLRQARLVGLTKWRALHIIDLLPSVLHLSLLLFSFGLILYLSQLDPGIAAVIAVVTGGTFLFYVVTALSGAIYEFCPFVTQISGYIRKILIFYAENWMTGTGGSSERDKHPHDNTTDDDLHALLWLAENARDPSAGDCSYQALAGLRLKPLKDSKGVAPQNSPEKLAINEATIEHKNTPNNDKSSENSSNQYDLVLGVFESVCTRLSQVAIQQPRELIACQGMNAARYANALPKLVDFLQDHGSHQMPSKSGAKINSNLNLHGTSKTPAQVAFVALDNIWCNECPALGLGSYTLLTSAELRLTKVVAVSRSNQHSPTNTAMIQNDNKPSQAHVEIPVDSMQKPLSESSVTSFNLRARYSRALSRAAYLLRYHADDMDEGQTFTSSESLTHLLDSINESMQCADLNLESQLSTHQSQSPSSPAPSINIRVLGKGDNLYVDPNCIGDFDGLLVGILRLLGSTGVQANPTLEHAAENALHAVVPILLNQWLNITEPLTNNQEQTSQSESRLRLNQWSELTEPVRSNIRTDWAAWQALGIALIILPHAGRPGTKELPERAISTLYKRLKNDPNRGRAFFTFWVQRETIMDQLISLVDQHRSKLSQTALKSFINIFSLTYCGVTFLQTPGFSRENIPPLLRTLVKLPGQISELQALLGILEDNFQSSLWYLQSFVHSEGFNSLLQLKEHEDCQLMVAKCVGRITQCIAEFSWGIEVQTVPGFFDAVSFALKVLSDDEKCSADLLSIMRNTTPLLRLFPADSSYSAGVAAVRAAMQTNTKPSEEQAILMAELDELESWLDTNEIPQRGFTSLFE